MDKLSKIKLNSKPVGNTVAMNSTGVIPQGYVNNAVNNTNMFYVPESAFTGAAQLYNNLSNSASINDTSGIENDITSINDISKMPAYNAADLSELYSNIETPTIYYNSIRGMGGKGVTKEKTGSVLSSALTGTTIGTTLGGPMGAAIGAGLGLLSGIGGVLTGDTKAKLKQQTLANDAYVARQNALNNLLAQSDRIMATQGREAYANRIANGGELNRAMLSFSKTAKGNNMTALQFLNKTKSNMYANGGQLDEATTMSKYNTHGGYYSPKLSSVNAGGTHEQNPYGGVKLGVDINGIPNLVEEGETVYDDYVFSDRLKPSVSELKAYNLPEKYSGKTFSEISSLLAEEADNRPNDAVSNAGLGAMLDRLIAAQEEHKQKIEALEFKKAMDEMSPKEILEVGNMLDKMQQEQQAEQEQQIEQEQQMQQNYAPQEEYAQQILPQEQLGLYDNQMMAYGGRLFDNGGKKNNEDVMDIRNQEQIAAINDLRNGYLLPYTNPNDTLIPPSKPQRHITRYTTKRDSQSAFDPTYLRYSGAVGNAIDALYNATQEPTKFDFGKIRPQYISGDLNLQRQKYNPFDYNIAANQLRAQSNATRRAITNSGYSPSTGTMLVAAGNNASQTLGDTLLQGRLQNEQMRNQTIAANNAARQAEAAFDYQRNAANAQIANATAQYNNQLRNNQLLQNDAAETQKYTALSQALDAAYTDLSNIGREQFVFNQIKSNPALLYNYLNGQNGEIEYKNKAGKNRKTLLKKTDK